MAAARNKQCSRTKRRLAVCRQLNPASGARSDSADQRAQKAIGSRAAKRPRTRRARSSARQRRRAASASPRLTINNMRARASIKVGDDALARRPPAHSSLILVVLKAIGDGGGGEQRRRRSAAAATSSSRSECAPPVDGRSFVCARNVAATASERLGAFGRLRRSSSIVCV